MPAILVSFLLLFNFSLRAQERKYCHTDEMYHEAVAAHPEILQREQQLEQFTRDFIQSHGSERRMHANGTTSTVYIIPLVFHIIHEYGPENISDAQVIDAVNILNRDYRRLNADTVNIINEFKQLSADIEIEFRLAKIDPNGNCTSGIERIESFRTYIGDDLAKFNSWDHTKYLNIWTVAAFSAAHATAAAYAYKPGSAPLNIYDGVIALSNYVGSIGTGTVNGSRTLTHEIGHCFNLSHPWGNTNQPGVACGDDNVNDTPITKGWDHCPSSNYDVCATGVNENFQNYMDYSYCDCMFTYGQKARMVAALNSAMGGRDSLWQPSNLAATGTDGSPPQLCKPVADFYPYRDRLCAGDSIQFMSNAYNSDTINYIWTFPTGSPSSSTQKNPYVTFVTPGTHDAKLVVYNSSGSDSITKTQVVTATGAPLFNPDYFDDFETAGTFPGDGYIINSAGNQWQRVTNAGYSGTACLKFLNYNQSQAGLVDAYVTPAMYTQGYINPSLTFRMAYARKDVTKTDLLKIYISTSCGKSWTLRRTLQGAQLITHATVTGAFTPTSQADWALVTVNVSQIANKPSARVKFEFTSGGDNNIYIDDINITLDSVLSGTQEAAIAGLNYEVFPNPSEDMFHISFDLPQADKTEIKISDLLGQEVKSVVREHLSEGYHEYQVDGTGLSKGIYLISLKAGEIFTVKKLVIE